MMKKTLCYIAVRKHSYKPIIENITYFEESFKELFGSLYGAIDEFFLTKEENLLYDRCLTEIQEGNEINFYFIKEDSYLIERYFQSYIFRNCGNEIIYICEV